MSDSFTAGSETAESSYIEEDAVCSTAEGRVQKIWLARLSAEEKAHKEYRHRARVVSEMYENTLQDEILYVPLYWSVMKVEKSGVYSAQPVPEVRPRNEAQNPVYLSVARIIERGLSFCTDQKSFDDNFSRAVWDYLGVSLGVSRVKVDSIINKTTTTAPILDMMGQQVGTREEVDEQIGDQFLRWEYVPWRRFGWEPCNNWRTCSYVYFRHRMTKKQIRERFGRMVKATKDPKEKGSTDDWKRKTWDVYEIWDKKDKKVLFIAKGESEPLEVHDDPLGLVDFFPCPPPMFNNLPSEEIIPVPDYDYIEQYDIELNRLQERRKGLLEQIKAAGAYDSSLTELGDMLELEDGQFKPIQNLIARAATAGGTDKIVHYLPIMEKAQVLDQLNNNIQFVKGQVDEVLGIADIVRGVTNAYESKGAQEIKGRWVGVRLTDKREMVQYTVREMMRIMAQLLSSHITPENLSRMTQMQVTEEMQQLMSDDMLMQFVVDIEVDSTIAKDEMQEMETKQEMLNGVAQYSQAVLPMVQQGMMPADVSSAILRAALSPYAKYDRSLGEALGNLQGTQEQLQQMTQQAQQKDQELAQAQQQSQQWQAIATQLQALATEAKAAKELAQANTEGAKTRKLNAEADLTREKAFSEHEHHGSHPKIGSPTDDMESKNINSFDAETRRMQAEQKPNGQGSVN